MRLELCIGLMMLYTAAPAQRRVSGTVVDARGNGPVASVTITWKQNARQVSSVSDASGRYSLSIPTTVSSLSFEKKGFRKSWLNLDTTAAEASSVEIRLMPADKLADNAVYQQSEQRHTVLERGVNEKKTQRFNLWAVDATNGDTLEAMFTLFSTNSKKRTVYNTSKASPLLPVGFTEKDIIALEVVSPGYQDYKGNLIIKSFGETRANVISLTRGQNVLTVQLAAPSLQPTDAISCRITPGGGRQAQELTQFPGLSFSGNLRAPGSYLLEIVRNDEVVQSSRLQLTTGLNSLRFFLNPEGNITALGSQLTDTVIYFNQSRPELRDDAKMVLNMVAAQLAFDRTARLRVIGHTDNVGQKNLNLLLSEYRVKTTCNYLYQKGIQQNRITGIWKGDMMPVASNAEEDGKKKNRRVEIFFETNR